MLRRQLEQTWLRRTGMDNMPVLDCHWFVDVSAGELDRLQCAICSGVARNPPNLGCAHLFCKCCLQETSHRQHNDQGSFPCPTCRSELVLTALAANEFVIQRVASAKIKCPNHTDGCNVQMVMGIEGRNLQAHMKDCEFVKEECQLCHETIPRNQMKVHMKSECNNRVVICAHCGDSVRANQKHANFWGDGGMACLHVVPCPNGCTTFIDIEEDMDTDASVQIIGRQCITRVHKDQVESHCRRSCKNRHITCDACGATMQAHEEAAHGSDMFHLNHRMIAMQLAMNEMRDKIASLASDASIRRERIKRVANLPPSPLQISSDDEADDFDNLLVPRIDRIDVNERVEYLRR